MIGAADHVCDPVVHVLDRVREVVGRPPVGADDHEILELLVRELDPAADGVLPRGHALVGHAEADRALVLVGLLLLHEARRQVAAAPHCIELERDRPIPVDPEPLKRVLDLLGRVRDFPADVGVLDPQQALASAAAREQPVEEERAHAADVQKSRRAGRHTHANTHAPLRRRQSRHLRSLLSSVEPTLMQQA